MDFMVHTEECNLELKGSAAAVIEVHMGFS